MKKILTASLVAIMAVTAANADIASTQYVTTRTGDVSFTNAKVAANATNLTEAVMKLDTKLNDIAGSGDGSIENQINSAIGDLGTDSSGTNIETVAAAISNAQNVAVTTAGTNTDAKIQALDVVDTAVAGSYVSAVSETDGKVKISRVEFDNALSDTSTNAVQNKVVKEALDAKQTITNIAVSTDLTNLTADDKKTRYTSVEAAESIVNSATNTLSEGFGKLSTKVDSLESTDTEIKASIADIEDSIGTVADGTNVVTMISEATSDLQTQIDDVKSGNSLGNEAVKTANIAGGAVTETQLNDTVNASLDLADSALQKNDIATGTADGTISVEGTDVAVQGLGSAAYTKSSDYDKAGAATNAVAALDASTTGTGVLKSITQTDGKISGTASLIVNSDITDTTIQKVKLDTSVQNSLTAADNAMNWEALKKDTSWTTAGCATAGTKCSLTANGGSIAWEKIAE